MKHPNGSSWKKWDLHFHTPSSYDYQNKSISNEEIILELSGKGVSAIAITDHHIIDVERIKELQDIGLKNGIRVFPGIEFLAEARGSEPVHYIAIFPEDCDLSFVWKQLENRTQIKEIQGRGKAPNEVYCVIIDTIEIIKELGGIVTIHAGKKPTV